MSLGIEIGNDFMVVTAVRQGVDVLQNDIGKRKTRVAVTYGAEERMIGDDSYAGYISKFNQSATYFKRLLGKQWGVDDEDIKKELAFLPNKMTKPNPDGTPSSVMFELPRVGVLPPEQAFCTMLLKAKQIYEINSEGQHVQECVITVPTYFNNAQRNAVMNAAQMAGLKVLELTNETTAILYQYGLQRKIEDQRYVMFYDMGATTTSCTLARITPESAEVLAYEANPHLGGRDFIECIVEDIAKWCKTEKKVDIEPNSKAWIKLRRACEKTFHTLSANSTAKVTVENITDTLDLNIPYTRETFYKVLEDRFKDQILQPLQKIVDTYPELMVNGKLAVNFFEIIGGVTRVPFVQNLLIENYGITLSKTLDADEAIARGAALRCAALSTTKKIRRKFIVHEKKLQVDLALYSLPEQHKNVKENDPLDTIQFEESNVLTTKSFGAAYPTTYPQPRLLSIKFQQIQLPIVVGVKLNGSKIDNLRALVLPQSRIDGRLFADTADGNAPVDIKVSLSLNSSGYMTVYNVETIPQKVEVPVPTPQQQEQPQQTMTDNAEAPAAATTPATEGEKKEETTEAPAAAAATEGEEKKAEETTEEKKEEAEAKPTMTDDAEAATTTTEPAAAPATEGEEKKEETTEAAPQQQEEKKQEEATTPQADNSMSDVPKPEATPQQQQQQQQPQPQQQQPQQTQIVQGKPIPLCIYNQTIGCLSSKQLQAARESEAKLQERDAATRRRQEVYNNLESFLYTTRSRLADSNDLPKYLTPDQTKTIAAKVKAQLEWVDDEAYCADIETLQKKLQESQTWTADVEVRSREHKNLISSHFAYSATLEKVIAHQYAGAEKFAKAVGEHVEMEAKAKKGLDVYLEAVPVSSQQVDRYHDHLRKLLAAMNNYDPVKEAQEKAAREAREAQEKALAAQRAAEKLAREQAEKAAKEQAEKAAAEAAAAAQAAQEAAQQQQEAEAAAAAAAATAEVKADDNAMTDEPVVATEAEAAAAAPTDEAPAVDVAAPVGESMVEEAVSEVKTEEVAPAATEATTESMEEVAPAATEAPVEAELKVEEPTATAEVKVDDNAMTDEPVVAAPVVEEEKKEEVAAATEETTAQ